MEYRDYYKIMGVGREASADEIKRAYRRLARKYHPDVSKEKDAEARFKELGEAYEVLRDPEKRAAYDSLGSPQSGEEFRPPPEWRFDFGADARPHGHSDFFENLFGGLGGAGGQGFRFEATARVDLTLEEAYSGAERTLAVEHVESDGRGGRRRVPHSVRVRIPAGVVDGQHVRVAPKGGVAGAPRQDVILVIRLLPHRWFRVSDRDVWLDLPVTAWEAALGETVRVPTLGGRVDLKLPRGAQTDQQLRLKGRGLPGDPPGDQYVVIKVQAPAPRTAADEALYRQLGKALATNPRAPLEE